MQYVIENEMFQAKHFRLGSDCSGSTLYVQDLGISAPVFRLIRLCHIWEEWVWSVEWRQGLPDIFPEPFNQSHVNISFQ